MQFKQKKNKQKHKIVLNEYGGVKYFYKIGIIGIKLSAFLVLKSVR